MTTISLKDMPQRVHLVGIGGIHMSAIAKILKSRGHFVTGSDLQKSPIIDDLMQLGITIFQGHSSNNIGNAELIIHTAATTKDNPEVIEGNERGIPIIKRAQAVACIMNGKKSIAVAGSHGKTTTSTIISYMLWKAGLDPTILLGGEPRRML